MQSYVTVPRSLTPEMAAAMNSAPNATTDSVLQDMQNVWDAAIATAPPVTEEPVAWPTEQDKAWARVMVKLLAATGAKVRSEKVVNSDPDTRCSWIETADGAGICDISNDCAALLTGPAKDREAVPLYTHPAPPVAAEPVAWMFEWNDASGNWLPALSQVKPGDDPDHIRKVTPLYTHPKAEQAVAEQPVWTKDGKPLSVSEALDEAIASARRTGSENLLTLLERLKSERAAVAAQEPVQPVACPCCGSHKTKPTVGNGVGATHDCLQCGHCFTPGAVAAQEPRRAPWTKPMTIEAAVAEAAQEPVQPLPTQEEVMRLADEYAEECRVLGERQTEARAALLAALAALPREEQP